MKKVNELYLGLLPLVGLTTNENHQVFIGGGEIGACKKLDIEERDVYIGDDSVIKNPELKDAIIFHPLAENTLKKRSPMLTAIQNTLTLRTFMCGKFLVEALLKCCIKQKAGEPITDPKILTYLQGNEDCDEKVLTFFNKLVESIETDPSKKFFSVYLKHGTPEVDGYSRSCTITSPLVQELERVASIGSVKAGGLKVWGIESLRKKDLELLANLIKSVFPGLENKRYQSGSLDKFSPYCDSLFQTVLNFNTDVVNAGMALKKIEPVTSVIEYLLVDTSPVEELLANRENYDIFRNQIMRTAFNDGGEWTSRVKTVKDEESGNVSIVDEKTEEPIAMSRKIIQNAIKPIPGTRQPIVNISEEENRSLRDSERPRRPHRSDREEPPRRGFEPPQYSSRNQSRNDSSAPYYSQNFRSSDFRNVRDVEDIIFKLKRLARDFEDERRYDDLKDCEEDLKTLRRIQRDFEDNDDYRPRRSRGRDYDDYDDDRRARPRVSNRNNREERTDRFGRRR